MSNVPQFTILSGNLSDILRGLCAQQTNCAPSVSDGQRASVRECTDCSTQTVDEDKPLSADVSCQTDEVVMRSLSTQTDAADDELPCISLGSLEGVISGANSAGPSDVSSNAAPVLGVYRRASSTAVETVGNSLRSTCATPFNFVSAGWGAAASAATSSSMATLGTFDCSSPAELASSTNFASVSVISPSPTPSTAAAATGQFRGLPASMTNSAPASVLRSSPTPSTAAAATRRLSGLPASMTNFALASVLSSSPTPSTAVARRSQSSGLPASSDSTLADANPFDQPFEEQDRLLSQFIDLTTEQPIPPRNVARRRASVPARFAEDIDDPSPIGAERVSQRRLPLRQTGGASAKRAKKGKAVTGVMCPLCRKKTANTMTLPCRHYFCNDCIAEWHEQWPHCPACKMSPFTTTPATF